MPTFSTISKNRLVTCHPDIRRVLWKVIERYDIRVICGHRDKVGQNIAHRNGYSRVKWPNSSHNSEPSDAVDIAPWPIDWNDTSRFYKMAAFVMEVAMKEGVRLKWGGNYPIRGVSDLLDLVHFVRY